jgi:hypothetical protein
MTDDTTTTIPSLEDWQHWAPGHGAANQMMMEAPGRQSGAGQVDARLRTASAACDQ